MTNRISSVVSCDHLAGCVEQVTSDDAHAFRRAKEAGWKRVHKGPTSGGRYLDLCPAHATACPTCHGEPPVGFSCNSCGVAR